ncbi:hypothetical protein BDY17DRAFT_299428 [Neohortaea acidophila]|uniref:Uncharacterized protein n=1 Tax=Neohortaea acidophila TaxID=245834 RepID=A0A6A6PQE5_9PEZI|nr:uncharacterized protein BDY17DRAFT_299428 [Neohortaea acidophila]KAF2481663.1 hypothetical protein BDY17DRAFT_299428 [Neohortaea acidophila]
MQVKLLQSPCSDPNQRKTKHSCICSLPTSVLWLRALRSFFVSSQPQQSHTSIPVIQIRSCTVLHYFPFSLDRHLFRQDGRSGMFLPARVCIKARRQGWLSLAYTCRLRAPAQYLTTARFIPTVVRQHGMISITLPSKAFDGHENGRSVQ